MRCRYPSPGLGSRGSPGLTEASSLPLSLGLEFDLCPKAIMFRVVCQLERLGVRSISTLRPASVRTQIRGAHAQSCPALCDPWTLALQAPLSVGFCRENTGVGWHVLLQGVFPAQGWNPRVLSLLQQQVHPSPLHHQGTHMVPLSSAKKGAIPSGARQGPPPASRALKGPPSLWAPPVQVPILGGGPGFPPWTGVSPGLPPKLLSPSNAAPRPSGLSCLDLLCGSRQAAHNWE